MQVKTVDLYEYFGVEKPQNALGILTSYVIGNYDYCPNRVRPAMLVIAGGAYAIVSRREMEPVAIAYLKEGFNAYTLDYTCGVAYPTPLIEACMAIAYIRENAKSDCTDSSHVGAIGFSAGGHLTGMLATMFDAPEVVKALGDRNVRADGVVLSYPVITNDDKAHRYSMQVISGNDKELENRLSLETRVTRNSSPAFIWTTYEDDTVPCENSIYMTNAYIKAGVPCEFHMFEKGHHGLSLATKETMPELEYIQDWFKLSVSWLKMRGFTITE